jgi:hypothetical protein
LKPNKFKEKILLKNCSWKPVVKVYKWIGQCCSLGKRKEGKEKSGPKTVLPTKFKNFLLNQPKNSAAG